MSSKVPAFKSLKDQQPQLCNSVTFELATFLIHVWWCLAADAAVALVAVVLW
jgi:hypothetical protein